MGKIKLGSIMVIKYNHETEKKKFTMNKKDIMTCLIQYACKYNSLYT